VSPQAERERSDAGSKESRLRGMPRLGAFTIPVKEVTSDTFGRSVVVLLPDVRLEFVSLLFEVAISKS
jgi:hypothetical protein